MWAIDANILSFIIYPASSAPPDFRTGLSIERSHERAEQILAEAELSGEIILIPSPAFSEALVMVAENIGPYLQAFSDSSRFSIGPFGTKAAVEVAIRTRAAKDSGNKRDRIIAPWPKVKYDRQIVAIAHAEGASAIYTTDLDIYKHGALWNIPVRHLADVVLPPKQSFMTFVTEERTGLPDPPPR